MNIDAICDRIRADYTSFPQEQSYELYADDVFFKDPLNQFKGVEQYRKMIGFIEKWFKHPNLELHELEKTSENAFKTRWTLSWIAPLPWQPAIAIPGWTDYRLNEAGKISSHVDHWQCSRLAVLGQIFGFGKGN